jgi:hypothetical protein
MPVFVVQEHEDADARREEASKAEADANEKVADAQAKAAASQQHADELEVALKRAQLLAATAASRAEVYAGDAASNATALGILSLRALALNLHRHCKSDCHRRCTQPCIIGAT